MVVIASPDMIKERGRGVLDIDGVLLRLTDH